MRFHDDVLRSRLRFLQDKEGALAPALALLVAVCAGCSTTASTGEASNDGGLAAADSGSAGAVGSDSSTGADTSSQSEDSGGSANVVDASMSDDAGGSNDASAPDDASDGSSLLSGRQVLVWIPTYLDNFSANLGSVTGSSPKAFTQVSPDFYNLNYNYMSGAAQISGESFDGLSVAQVAQQVHAAGMQLIPLVYAGAGNSGTDQGIQNILNDSPAGTQNNFITAMVQEAQTRQYDGWNLDFEVGNSGTGYAQYGALYVSFLTAFRAALNAQHMILTVNIADWYIRQCSNDGLVDLTTIGPSVNLAIIEDYAGSLGSPLASCPGGTPPGSQNCGDGNDFGALLNIMCDVSPTSAVSIGLIEGSGGSGANPFLDQALSAVSTLGFTSVAVWPDENPFLNAANIPNGATWYSLLGGYLAGQ